MKCNNCGIDYPDTYLKCPDCTAPNIDAQSRFQNPPQKQRPPYKTAIELIREVGKHKLYLPACILTTVGAALGLITSGPDVITILITIAMWLFLSESKKDANPYKMDLTSIKMLKVIKTIQLVLTWIAIGLIGLYLPLMLLGISEITSTNNSTATAVASVLAIFAVIIMLVGIGVLVLSVIQTSGLRHYFKSAIESAETGLRPKKLPKAAPVIMLVISCIGIVTSVTTMFSSGLIIDYISKATASILPLDFTSLSRITMVFSCLATIVTYVAHILLSLVLLDARKLADASYYPNPEEAFYNKQIYYGNNPNLCAPFSAPVQPTEQVLINTQPALTQTQTVTQTDTKTQEPAEQTPEDNSTDNSNE